MSHPQSDPKRRTKLRPDRPCMAIATERDLCGKPTAAERSVVVVIGKSFVPINLCRNHAKPAEKRGGR